MSTAQDIAARENLPLATMEIEGEEVSVALESNHSQTLVIVEGDEWATTIKVDVTGISMEDAKQYARRVAEPATQLRRAPFDVEVELSTEGQ